MYCNDDDDDGDDDDYKQQRSKSQRNQKLLNLQVFALDMFLSGGGTFSAIFIYFIVVSDPTISEATRLDLFITYLTCILYWFFQLFTAHRSSLTRLLRQYSDDQQRSTTRSVDDEKVDAACFAVVPAVDVVETTERKDSEASGSDYDMTTIADV